MRPIDADALIEFCAERWIPLNIDAVNMQPTIEPEKAQHLQEGTTSDLISRQAAIDLVTDMEFMNFTAKGILRDSLRKLSPAQPEPQWIPVERELPEDFTDVLVWFEYFRYGDYNCLYQTHGIGTYVANYNLWTVNHETGWKDLRVIAWMPLPEAYKPNK